MKPNRHPLRERCSMPEDEPTNVNEPNAFAIFPRAQSEQSVPRRRFNLMRVGIRAIGEPKV